jgi:GST-like protein
MGGLGPMLGQNHHFNRYAPEEVPYAIRRYHQETSRLYAVLDGRLAESEFICNEYSIADMACYPWILRYEWHKTDIDQFPNVKRWLESIRQRPAVVAAYREAEKINKGKAVTSGAQQILFGQDATTMRKAMGTASESGN